MTPTELASHPYMTRLAIGYIAERIEKTQAHQNRLIKKSIGSTNALVIVSQGRFQMRSVYVPEHRHQRIVLLENHRPVASFAGSQYQYAALEFIRLVQSTEIESSPSPLTI